MLENLTTEAITNILIGADDLEAMAAKSKLDYADITAVTNAARIIRALVSKLGERTTALTTIQGCCTYGLALSDDAKHEKTMLVRINEVATEALNAPTAAQETPSADNMSPDSWRQVEFARNDMRALVGRIPEGDTNSQLAANALATLEKLCKREI